MKEKGRVQWKHKTARTGLSWDRSGWAEEDFRKEVLYKYRPEECFM